MKVLQAIQKINQIKSYTWQIHAQECAGAQITGLPPDRFTFVCFIHRFCALVQMAES